MNFDGLFDSGSFILWWVMQWCSILYSQWRSSITSLYFQFIGAFSLYTWLGKGKLTILSFFCSAVLYLYISDVIVQVCFYLFYPQGWKDSLVCGSLCIANVTLLSAMPVTSRMPPRCVGGPILHFTMLLLIHVIILTFVILSMSHKNCIKTWCLYKICNWSFNPSDTNM